MKLSKVKADYDDKGKKKYFDSINKYGKDVCGGYVNYKGL